MTSKKAVKAVKAFVQVRPWGDILMRSCARNGTASKAFTASAYGPGVCIDETETVQVWIVPVSGYFPPKPIPTRGGAKRRTKK